MKIIKYYSIIFLSFFYLSSANSSEVDIYKKIDLFGEVLEKINREYIDEINQSESMDSAINGLLQSLDPYSSYICLLYTSPSPRDKRQSRMPSSA